MVKRAVLVLALGIVAACGGPPICDRREMWKDCAEYLSLPSHTLADYERVCYHAPGGTWGSGGCSHAGALGGCKLPIEPGEIVTWYYVGGPYSDAAALMASCSRQSGTFLAP